MKISKKIINSRHLGYIAGVSFVLTKKGQKRAQDSNNSFQVNHIIKDLKNQSNSYFLKSSLTALALFYMWCPSALMAMNDATEEEKQFFSSYFKGWDVPKEGDNDDIPSDFLESIHNSPFYCPSPFSSEKTFFLTMTVSKIQQANLLRLLIQNKKIALNHLNHWRGQWSHSLLLLRTS